jgi:hypothetical protein
MTRVGLKRKNFLLCSLTMVAVLIRLGVLSSSSSSRCHRFVGIRCLASAFASSSQRHCTRSNKNQHWVLSLGRTTTGKNSNNNSIINHHRRNWIQHLHQRGGASSSYIDNNDNLLYASTSPIDTSSTPLQNADGSVNGLSDNNHHNSVSSSLEERATESIAIAGKSTALKTFGGLTYRDALAEEERFRVLFILGGPGT